eukprot:COSAG02_NODE_1795_length_10906_cov_5.562084_9_plen_350_part_00
MVRRATALFAWWPAFHSDFTPWASGKAGAAARASRLPYEMEENRPLHVALFRYAGLLGRRGVHRTAAEVCRLLISLEPRGDPMGTLLCFDYYCLRSSGCQPVDLLLPFVARFSFRHTLLLPNFSYSTALARRLADGDSGAGSAEPLRLPELQRLVSLTDPTALAAEQLAARALVLYPTMLSPLLQKVGAASEVAAVAVLAHPFFSDSVGTAPYSSLLTRLVEVYVERSAALHKPQVVWLVAQAQRVTEAMDAASQAERNLFNDAAHGSRLRALTGGHVPNSWSSVLLADFSDDVQALPADEMIGANAHAGENGAAQGDTPFHVDRGMHPVLAFFATMLPSAGAPPLHAD